VDPDFVINARADALALAGVGEVIRLGNAYLGAGATMVFVDGLDSKASAARIVKGMRGPVAINAVEGGKTPPDFDFAAMVAMGIARVSLPGTTMFAAIHGIRAALRAVKDHGGTRDYESLIADFREMHALVGMPGILKLIASTWSEKQRSSDLAQAARRIIAARE